MQFTRDVFKYINRPCHKINMIGYYNPIKNRNIYPKLIIKDVIIIY